MKGGILLIISRALMGKSAHCYDKNLKTCHITNITKTIISGHEAKPNSISVDVLEYDMRSTCSISGQIDCFVILTKDLNN